MSSVAKRPSAESKMKSTVSPLAASATIDACARSTTAAASATTISTEVPMFLQSELSIVFVDRRYHSLCPCSERVSCVSLGTCRGCRVRLLTGLYWAAFVIIGGERVSHCVYSILIISLSVRLLFARRN